MSFKKSKPSQLSDTRNVIAQTLSTEMRNSELKNHIHYPRVVAQKLEHALGDPLDSDSLMPYRKIMELDEAESFQDEFVQRMLALKLHHHYVPTEWGGLLQTYEQLYEIGKVLARRDLSTAVSMSTLIWSNLVWIGGDSDLKARCSGLTMAHNGAMCLAYSEEDHGADLIASECTATETEDGFVLNGEKWPINRATRSEVVMLLARTDSNGGARSLSLFMVEKTALDSSSYSYLPKTRTHGLRGCDISGIRFAGAKIPKSALIGSVGDGLELAIKTFQVTRTLCVSLSVGAAQSNLRVVMDFALARRLYGSSVYEIPNAQYHLTGAFSELLVTDAIGVSLARAIHVLPRQLSILSAVAKFIAPYKLDRVQGDLATVLGARYFMREKHKEGVFQKNVRDSQVVALFDGSSEINLFTIVSFLPILMRRQIRQFDKNNEVDEKLLDAVFNLSVSLPEFNGDSLDLSSHGRDFIMESFPQTLFALRTIVHQGHASDLLLQQAQHIFDIHVRNAETVNGMDFKATSKVSPEMFRLARDYANVHGAVCALNYWLRNRHEADEFLRRGSWLAQGLYRILHDLQANPEQIPEPDQSEIAVELKKRTENNYAFGVTPSPLFGTHETAEIQ